MTHRPPSRNPSDGPKRGSPGPASSRVPSSPDTERQSAELAVMRRMLTASSGVFSLSFGVCNSPALRDSLVDRLIEEDASYARVSVPNGTEGVLAAVQQSLGARAPSALFVVDLENSLPSDGPRPAIRSLNATREKWQRYCSCPVVVWLPEYAVKLLAVEARDFWAWRSHQFEFVGEEQCSQLFRLVRDSWWPRGTILLAMMTCDSGITSVILVSGSGRVRNLYSIIGRGTTMREISSYLSSLSQARMVSM